MQVIIVVFAYIAVLGRVVLTLSIILYWPNASEKEYGVEEGLFGYVLVRV